MIPKATEGAGSTPESRSTEFKAVEGGPETMSGNTLMVEAYAVLWVILMGWIFFVWRKQAGLHSRLDELEKVLDQAAAQRAKR
ncbi:CcmD family protein [bacterium]|nr:MAG: CcmD family protein [bacterium]